MKKITLLIALFMSYLSFGQVVINEVDADQTGTDTMEFVELFSETPNQSLDGLVLVLFNGSDDASYNAIDLTGFSTDGNGFFIVGGDEVAGADIMIGANNTIQNGADGIGIYTGNIADFPNDTPATTTNLIDAIVYGTNDADDVDLLAALGQTIQYNEDNVDADIESLQRRDDGTFCTATPTPRATNGCSACALVFSFNDATCDDVTTGVDGVTYLVDFTGGAGEAITLALDGTTGTIGGDNPSTQATGTISISVDEGVDFALTATGATCDVSIDLFAVNCAPTADVADIATLRASAEGVEYLLTGEAILTFQQDFRNQKFIEDATGAILIDDSSGTITTMYTVGDGITGILGTLTSFQGMLQFVPSEDPGAATSTGNAVTPQMVTITALNANPNDFESEYVQIADVAVDNSANSTWVTGAEYPLSNADGDYVFRTSFFAVDYIGETVPTQATIAGIITERNNGDYFITARDLNDIENTSSCSLVLGTITATCDTETSSQDGTTITVAYTGGGNETYTLEVLGGGVISGDDPTTVAEGTITIIAVSEATTVTLEITSVNCNLSTDITTPACEPVPEVATIAALRAETEGEEYVLSTEAILTFQQSQRNQKWIEDATGAIVIDDPAGVITTTYAIGDGITGIRGTLGSFNGLMQFVPSQDAGAPSSMANPIAPQVVTITELNTNSENYESEYVAVAAVTVTNTSGDTNWLMDTNYEITNADGTFTLRTNFDEADYVVNPDAVPTTTVNIAGLIGQFNDTYQITPRSAADIDITLSVQENTIDGLSIYPNPAEDIVTITTTSNTQKEVTVFDITGKLVLRTNTVNTINVQTLETGMYLMTIKENNATATVKLIVR
ncbi:DUF5689 domain-containing protein [uncultured Dokdonia sp.]|uniref:DUF5689 domain-containing protein n=1 Tax=uncultured Dokdonia sp. TaxID=575653 RepID=UPI002615DDF3|nr:DUF5689 domain-containing protein [uncultured Dokdonia sp.]